MAKTATEMQIAAVPTVTGTVEGQIQYANSNAFAGIEEFYYDQPNGALYAGTNITNGDASITILADGTGEPTLNLSNPSAAVSLTCDANQKLKVEGGVNTFVFDVSSGTGGITFPDSSVQTTAASGVSFPLEGSDGSNSAPTYSFSADSDTGMYRVGGGVIGFTLDSVRTMALQSNTLRLDGTSNPQILKCDNAGVDLELRSGGGTYGKIRIGRENWDIDIQPAGTGAVEISGAYKLPTAVTGTNDYVLTAQTDGSTAWAAAGGGNDFNVELCGTELDASGTGYAVYDVMALAPYGVARFTTANIDTKQYFFPFISPFTGDVGTMYYNITSAAGSATNLYIAIYSDNNGVPDAVAGYATIDATVSGSQTTTSFSSTISLTRGTQYYIAYNKSTSEAITIRGVDNAYVPRITPSSGFPSTTNGYSTSLVSNSNVSSAPAAVTAEGLEGGVYFASLGVRPQIGLEI